ncbi:transposase [Streptomyces netropsis]|uniref:transposase n=1 Tax=Streptomyces netropsis TaxID=55404 RepID=UPI0037A78ED6
MRVLHRAWDEQYHRDRQEVRWREGKDLPPGRQRLASPYDIDARYGVKRGSGWTGYKAHLTETCEPGTAHLITNVETTDATLDDTAMTQTIHQHLNKRQMMPDEHVVDAGYGNAAHVLAARNDHGITLLGPVDTDTGHSRRDNQTPDLSQAAFHIDSDTQKVTCPQGKVSASWSDRREPSGTPVAQIYLAFTDCGPCPLRHHCTKATKGRWGRQLTLLPREQQQILAQQRAEQQTDEWKARYDTRAGIEGTISQAVRRTRLRRTPYPGQAKTHLANLLSATAINIIRLDAWLHSTPIGKTRTSHLAPPAPRRIKQSKRPVLRIPQQSHPGSGIPQRSPHVSPPRHHARKLSSRRLPQSRRPAVHERDRLQRGQRTRRILQRDVHRRDAPGLQDLLQRARCPLDAFRWLHRYNTRRRHSRLGQRSPIAYETASGTTSTTLSPAA